jgi:CxxC motif-containing protein (DUF1111 family)
MRQSVCTSRGGAGNLGTSGLGNRIGAGGVAVVLLVMACLTPADEAVFGGERVSAEQITAGQELFVRNWEVGDRRSVAGDGLGPMYNAASCAKCHRLGGLGGAGANDENVDLLTVKAPRELLTAKVPRNVSLAGNDLAQRVAKFHPALAAGRLSATTVLHRFSTDPIYDAWRKRFFTAGEPDPIADNRIAAVTTAASQYPVNATNPVQRLDGLAFQHSERNTPALFGAGLIDRLPDSVFERIEKHQAARTGGVSGRVPRAANGKVGRFGWRGQTENLHEFVLGACAVELGLAAPGHSQPIDPLNVRFDDNGRPVPPNEDRILKAKRLRLDDPGQPLPPLGLGLDISDEQCKSLTQFVAHLPPPRRLMPTDDVEAQRVTRGERQFQKIGCADCHVQQVANITGIYSDLLLHDMGAGLADPVPASPPRGAPGSASYYGGTDSLLVKVSPEQRREWRTPPLWGVRDSGPYLHDGRAETFTEAIAWHSGEAARSARDFRRLTKDEKDEVFAFLNCLAAPTSESLSLEKIALVGDQ